MNTMPYYHVDVFSDRPFSGNGLTVFSEADGMSSQLMQQLTREMRQFESIFLKQIDNHKFIAKVFTETEELDFAGHPVLGACAVLHRIYQENYLEFNWEIQLNKKIVKVTTKKSANGYRAIMNQGNADFGYILNKKEAGEILKAMNLSINDLQPGFLPLVISTGLPYLILPVRQNIFKAKIKAPALETRLDAYGAKFIGVLDVLTYTLRTWDNEGIVEDIATGSLAGPCAAFLVKYGFEKPETQFMLNQGHNLGRPSELFAEVRTEGNSRSINTYIGGDVCEIAHGFIKADLIDQYAI